MNSKPWYTSATYYALFVAIVSKILMMAGLAESDAGKQAGEIVTVVLPFIGICADLLAAWARKRAKGPLTLTKAGAETQNGQGGFASVWLLLVVAIASVIALSACVTPPHKVIETACTPGTQYSVERCVKGIAETWETYQKRAEIIVADPLTPPEVKAGVQQAEAATRPVIVDMLLAGGAYGQVKADLAAGTTEADKLVIANAKLEEWVAKALPLVRSFGDKLGR